MCCQPVPLGLLSVMPVRQNVSSFELTPYTIPYDPDVICFRCPEICVQLEPELSATEPAVKKTVFLNGINILYYQLTTRIATHFHCIALHYTVLQSRHSASLITLYYVETIILDWIVFTIHHFTELQIKPKIMPILGQFGTLQIHS